MLAATCVLSVGAFTVGTSQGWAAVRHIRFESLLLGSAGSADLQSPAIAIITSGGDAGRLLQRVRDQIIRNALQAVDFRERVAVAVFSGRKATGGYSVEIKEIAAGESTVRVRVMLVERTPGQVVHQAENFPYHIVLIQRSALPSTRTGRWVVYSDEGKVLAETQFPQD